MFMGRHSKGFFAEIKSNFDRIRILWDDIKYIPIVKKSYVITNPEIALKLYDRFEDKELGDMFVDVWGENPKYNEQAYFISVKLGKPIERKNKSELVKNIENFENMLEQKRVIPEYLEELIEALKKFNEK